MVSGAVIGADYDFPLYLTLVNFEVTRSYPLFLALEVEGPRFKSEEIRGTAYIRRRY